MQSNVLVVALAALFGLLSLVGTASACGAPQPAGVCCLLACPTFSPCWLKKACPTGPTVPPPPPPPVLEILTKVFDGIADIFKAVEALLPPGSPVLNILDNVFRDIGKIFTDVRTTIQAGRRKRASDKCGKDDDDEDSGSYGYGGKKNKGKLGYKSAKAANEAIKAAGELNEATGNEITKLTESAEYKGKSADYRKKGYRKALEKNDAEKAKIEKVLDAQAATLEEAKEATEKFIVKVSPEAKEAGKKLIAIILDEKLSIAEKEAQLDEHYGKLKPEWIKELNLKEISFIKRAAGIASCPFATLGSVRVPLKLEL